MNSNLFFLLLILLKVMKTYPHDFFKSFIVLTLIFGFFFQFELIFVYAVR